MCVCVPVLLAAVSLPSMMDELATGALGGTGPVVAGWRTAEIQGRERGRWPALSLSLSLSLSLDRKSVV